MRILILSQWFQPEAFFKGLPFAKALRARGHEVEVLTGFPNYPGGKLYPGYRIRPWRRQTMDGVRVNRVALYPSHDRSTWRRMVNYLSFAASTTLLGPWLAGNPDVIYVYNLVTLGPAARLLRQLSGGKIVLDVQDLWPESVAGSGMLKPRALGGLLTRWSNHEYRRADRLVVLSPGFKRNLVARGIPDEKVEVIYNWCDESVFAAPLSTAPRGDGAPRLHIVFAGTMGKLQALDVVVAAARRLQSSAPDVTFTLVGGGTEIVRLAEAAHGLPNVRFLPFRAPAEMGAIYADADALLVHLKDDPLFRITIPSKIQTYLCVGKPLLCGVKGDAAELVARSGAGVVFEPENAASLEQAVLTLRAMPMEYRAALGMAGRSFYRENLSFARGVERFEAVFASLAHSENGCSRN